MTCKSELKKLSEESLLQPPEKVFDVVCKLGEGSYGSVYKAIHKESSAVVAIKLVPVESDLHEIIKEISIMQQCDSPYVVRYYGSYFKQYDLWICMEYCGAGSVSDIMRLRKKTLTENEIATILSDAIKGLEYLHNRRKIHRDVKAGNILLNSEGHAKLADFGVAGQLTDTLSKRNTVIGTPFWMAPEVIEEVGYDCAADIWSIGITALEMAEGKPPYGDIHPMRAIFMIPQKPPPSFREPDKWSTEFIDFASQCLVKNPEERATAAGILEHEFIRNVKPRTILQQMIAEACEARENRVMSPLRRNYIKNLLQTQQNESMGERGAVNSTEEFDDSKTLVNTRKCESDNDGTMIEHSGNTLLAVAAATAVGDLAAGDKLESDLETLVINSDSKTSTLKRHSTNSDMARYKPSFLDYFSNASASGITDNIKTNTTKIGIMTKLDDIQQANLVSASTVMSSQLITSGDNIESHHAISSPSSSHSQQNQYGKDIRIDFCNMYNNNELRNLKIDHHQQNNHPNQKRIHYRNFVSNDFEFLKFLPFEDLQQRLNNIDLEMERDIEELNRKYNAKHQPILDAIEAKRKRQQNINNNLIKI